MKRLSAERRRRQARDPGQARLQKSRQMALGAGRTGPLYRHGDNHLTDRRAVLRPLLTTRPVDESDQIQLLGNPYQGSRVTDSLSTHSANQSQIRNGRWICRAQYNLPCERTLPAGIPHRLGCDAVSPATHLPLEYIHSFHLAISERLCQAKHAPLKAMDAIDASSNPLVLRKSG